MKRIKYIDKIGLLLYMIISLFGIANIYSVDSTSGIKQAVWFGVSILVMLSIFLLHEYFFQSIAPILYLIGIVSLIGVLIFGKEINGQKNWYVFGPISIQPVEFVKIAISLMLAHHISNSDNIVKLKQVLTIFSLIGIPSIIVLLQPDVGSLIVFTAFIVAFYREGLTGWVFVLAFTILGVVLGSLIVKPFYVVSIFAILMILGVYFSRISLGIRNITILLCSLVLISVLSFGASMVMKKLPKHQRERIEVLFKGEMAFRNTAGYNLLYSKTAIGSGQLFGKGYMEGAVTRGRFVPEQKTDYIFCTVGEEWGFLGSSILIIFYAIYIIRIYYLSEKQKVTFNRVFGYCFASILLIHFFVNVAMVLGLFPTVGIPLPYFSYGGSSLLAFSIMMAIFLKLDYEDKSSLI